MHLHALVERGDEEVVLILLPNLPRVGEAVEVDLLEEGFSAQGRSI